MATIERVNDAIGDPQNPHFYALPATDDRGNPLLILEDGIPAPWIPEAPAWIERRQAPRGFRRGENGEFIRLLEPDKVGTPGSVAAALNDWYGENARYILAVGGNANGRVVVTVRSNFSKEVGVILAQFTNVDMKVGEIPRPEPENVQ